MDDVNRAYQILGVTPTMSLEEIEAVYDELLEKYEHLADDNMYYKEKIAEWTDAFDCIIDHRIDITEHPSYQNHSDQRWLSSLVVVKLVFIVIIACIVIKQIGWLETPNQSVSNGSSIYELSNNFELSLSKFSEFTDWDWGYYEDGDQWTIILAIEVSKADEEGALINAYNFRLEEDCPTTLITKDIHSDEELNQVHYLGGYSELVPLNQKFGVVFNVAAFEQGEERILYYYYPDGSKHEVGRLIFDVLNNKEDQGIFS